MTNQRQHLNPVKHQHRVEYLKQRRRAQRADTARSGDDVMWLLIRALDAPHTASHAAQRLLSDYGYAQLGMAVYQRCRRVVKGESDPVRAKVVKGKPGRLNHVELRDYRHRQIVQGIMELLGDSDL